MSDAAKAEILERLFKTIESRKGADPASSYSAKLFAAGREKIVQKLGEEAVEAVIAGQKDDRGEIAAESADLLYHMMVLWADAGLTPAEVWAELARREGISGIEEKASRKRS